jgi:hypothetical protein
MNVLALLGAAAASMILLTAAVEKIQAPRALAETLRLLGVPKRMVFPVGIMVIVAELSVGVALLFRPDALLTQGVLVALAAAFACAGLRALRRGEQIPCSCFGSTRVAYLGRPQLWFFSLFVAVAAILRFGLPPVRGAVLFASVCLIIAVAGAWRVWLARADARSDRRSAEEMYRWLPSH